MSKLVVQIGMAVGEIGEERDKAQFILNKAKVCWNIMLYDLIYNKKGRLAKLHAMKYTKASNPQTLMVELRLFIIILFVAGLFHISS